MTDEAVVSLHDVTVRLGSVDALRQVSITVRAGERVALVGPSGAGKTTILNVMNGSVPVTSGQVTVFGQAANQVAGSELVALQRRVGTVYQDLALVGPLRVIHNVNAGHLGSWSTARALRSLARPIGVNQARAALERLGIADKLWVRTDRLSGGEQQRVAIARSLVQNAELLLADEPIASLDPARGREVLRLFCDIASEDRRALVVSLHSFDLAVELCDRVIGLRAGQVMFDSASSDIDPSIAATLYDLRSV